MRYFYFIIFYCVAQLAAAQEQEEHAWVYFTDKPNAATALENPLSILTQDAIDRKNLHNITIDVRDVPVDETYITTIKNQTGITVKAKSKWMNCVHVLGTQTNIEALESLSIVDSIHFAATSLNTTARVVQQTTTNNKLEMTIDFEYGNTQNQIEMLGVESLHEDDYAGEGMVIAVLDAGFPNVNTMNGFQRMRDNNDLLGGYDFVLRSNDYTNSELNSHGTLVLSDMAGYVEDQFVGTAPDASYYLFRTEDGTSETPVEESYWVEAAERSDSLGVDIINSSLGYSEYDNDNYSYSPSDMDGNTAFITKGANIAVEKGILVVTSAGNSGNDEDFNIISAPADGDAFTIGAVNAFENYASFSSIGPNANNIIKPDVVAQGQSSAIINSSDQLANASGTSFSSPIMAGAIACFWQAAPTKTNLEIMQLVRESASLYENPTDELGYGVPDFSTALTDLLGVNSFENTHIKVYPNPVASTLHISSESNLQNITLYNSVGQLVLQIKAEGSSNIDMNALEKGIYLLQIQTESGIQNFKILKQ